MPGRLCSACGRPLAEHEEGPKRLVVQPGLRGRGRLPIRRQRTYGCRVRLIQQSPISGIVSVPASGQRLAILNTRYVHESRFEGDLKPDA